jgi:hypothetical protein
MNVIYMINYILDLLGYNPDRVSEVLNFRFIVLLLFMIGVIFIIIEITKSYNRCPASEIKYRYIPRSFKEEQDEPVAISDLYGRMFDEASPWVGSFAKVPKAD